MKVIEAKFTKDHYDIKQGENVKIIQILDTQQPTGLSFGNMANKLYVEVFAVVVS